MESGDAALLGKESKSITWEMQQIIKAILNCGLPDPLRQIYLETKVQELFILQLQQFCEVPDDSKVRLDALDRQKLNDIREMITEKRSMPFTLTQLATHYGLNTDKLKKGYRQLFGTTVFGHLQLLKMEHAKTLLQNTNMPVADVAALSGYRNPQHFSNAFKNVYGVLPRDLKGKKSS